MVKEVKQLNQKLFVCEACGFGYKDATLAHQCEDYCSKHQSCSTELAKHAVSRCRQ